MSRASQLEKRIAILTEKIAWRQERMRCYVHGRDSNRGGQVTQIRRAASRAIAKLEAKRRALYDELWKARHPVPGVI